MVDTDVFVIGGGPAGLAAAIAAARHGLRVTIADGRRPPIDKACGEGLLPDSLAAAAALGITLPVHEARPFTGIRFIRGAARAEAAFHGSGALGIRRTVLQRVLTEQAERAGVTLMWNTPVLGVEPHTVRLAGASVSAKWIVGADGERSRARAWAGLGGLRRERLRFGFRRHYGVTPWTNFVEVYWAPNVQVYVTPVAHDEIGVASLSRNPRLRLDDALALVPELQRRLSGAPLRSSVRGAVTATRRLHAVTRGHVALIGDASGSVDAITGQGLGLLFRQAHALGEALAWEDLAQYQAAHVRIMRRPSWMAELLLAMDRWPWAGTRAMQAFSDCPGLFGGLLDVHTGRARPMAEIAMHARLGWHILCG